MGKLDNTLIMCSDAVKTFEAPKRSQLTLQNKSPSVRGRNRPPCQIGEWVKPVYAGTAAESSLDPGKWPFEWSLFAAMHRVSAASPAHC